MATTWCYNIEDDTAYSLVISADLKTEINALGTIAATANTVSFTGNTVSIIFSSTLTDLEAERLGTAIGNHDGRP